VVSDPGGTGVTGAELRAQLLERLDPLGAAPVDAGHSDYDLNPGWRGPGGGVRADAAVLVPIVDRAEPTVLLTRRSDALSNHAGQIAFPGGRMDPGETPEAAALREAEEEVGLSPERVTLIGRSSPYETVTGFAVTPVVGLVTPPFDLRLNGAEVAEAFEVPLALLLDETSYERRSHDGAGVERRRWFYAVPFDGRLIWGATAGMLRAFRARLMDAQEEAA
jgi:8-oxo-dGTP pyrophosphatase MutT (NUDIX family)